jgi:hypothetical protein
VVYFNYNKIKYVLLKNNSFENLIDYIPVSDFDKYEKLIDNYE